MKKKNQPSKAKAAEMLHDGTAHGKPLTDQQRKYFGYLSHADLGVTLPNYNDSNVSLSEGFKGEGYKAMNWDSPAWGGQFQLGGSLPGIGGHMYARTGGAPSNGKYAKKTLPSAQNGNFFPIEPWKKQGVLDSLGRGMMYRMTPSQQKNIYNIPIPKGVDPNSEGYITAGPGTGKDDPNNILLNQLNKNKINTYDIAGNTTNVNRPQGANALFEYGGEVAPYWVNGLDFKTKGMQQGGQIFDVNALKQRNAKRDSVRASLLEKYPLPRDYQKVNDGMLQYFQQEKPINDNKGQWNHPGKVTKVNSPDITMKGVPYPVLGISDTGHTQLMQPDGEYAFNGESVTEYPLNEVTKPNEQSKGQMKKLDQLTNFTNMEQGKSGIHIKPQNKGKFTAYKKRTGKTTAEALHSKDPHVRQMANFARNAKTWHHADYGDDIPLASQSLLPIPQLTGGPNTTTIAGSYNPPQLSGLQTIGQNLGGMQGIANTGTGILKGIQMLGQEKKQEQSAHQFAAMSDVIKQASGTRPQPVKRKYVRPEDIPLQPNQMFPTYGTGTNYLEHGGEIQNTYAPGTLYKDLAYEPLDDSNKLKQFQIGGFLSSPGAGQLAGQLGQVGGGLLGGGYNPLGGNAGSQIGGSLGEAAGNVLLPGVGGVLGKFAGSLIGGAVDQKGRRIKNYTNHAYGNLQTAAFQEGIQNTQNQYSAFMEDGGWMSHNWNPQIIAKVGDHDIKDLIKPDPMMNTLRAGGHISDLKYVQPPKSALQTYALGGELKTHWGGKAEHISNNPYLPDGGQTVMFRGQSHDEGGIGVTYGNSPVEVERGEPAVKLQDGGTGDNNLVVFGNMKIPSYGIQELNDDKAKGMKFKNYVSHLSKQEENQNKKVNKGLEILKNTDSDNAFDQLKMNSGKALFEGGNQKLKQIAEKKQIAANIQNAILDTAKEYNLDSDHLAKGKIKKAKFGGKLSAQDGKSVYDPITEAIDQIQRKDVDKYLSQGYDYVPGTKNKLVKYVPGTEGKMGSPEFNKAFGDARKAGKPQFTFKGKPYGTELGTPGSKKYAHILDDSTFEVPSPQMAGIPSIKGQPVVPQSTSQQVSTPNDKFDWINTVAHALPYFRPTNQLQLDPNQLSGEMFALSSNQLEPVQAQTYRPQLDTPYDISLQDQMNANQGDFNALQRLTNYNPAAQSILAGQKYAANSSILGEQFRQNQALKSAVYNKNRDTLNDAQLKNLAIYDQQYSRQAQAKSNTKAIAQAALSSIADKIAKNRLENRTLGVYENLYNYRFGPNGYAYNLNAPAQFNIPKVAKSGTKIKERNSNLVKAFKGL